MTRHVIAPVSELPPGTRKFLTIDERPIAVFNIKGEFFGLLNRCPHQGAALCEGPLIGLAQSSDPGEIEYTRLGEILRCPWHGWEFDIRTGQSWCDPKRFRVKAYPVNVEPGSAVVKGPYVAETVKVSVESDYVVVELLAVGPGRATARTRNLKIPGSLALLAPRNDSRVRYAPSSAAPAHNAPAPRNDRCRARTCHRAS